MRTAIFFITTTMFLCFMCNIARSNQLDLTLTDWQMHHGEGIVSFGFKTDRHGAKEEYDFAEIPPADDKGWSSAPNPKTIGFSRYSTLCGKMGCREGADFTYFQLYVNIPEDTDLEEFSIDFSGIDDGVQVSIFNSVFPDGKVIGYVFGGESRKIDITEDVESGEINRVVVIHTDDCCSGSRLDSAKVKIQEMLFCDGKQVTIRGTESHDIIRGTDGRDVIHGLAGHDIIYAKGGNDIVCGGEGNDYICGHEGNDKLFGGDGNDFLGGDEGNDRLYGEKGNDTLWGDVDDDILVGGPGHDVLGGADGDDILRGGSGNDTLKGWDGIDQLYGGWGNDTCYDEDGTLNEDCEVFIVPTAAADQAEELEAEYEDFVVDDEAEDEEW